MHTLRLTTERGLVCECGTRIALPESYASHYPVEDCVQTLIELHRNHAEVALMGGQWVREAPVLPIEK